MKAVTSLKENHLSLQISVITQNQKNLQILSKFCLI